MCWVFAVCLFGLYGVALDGFARVVWVLWICADTGFGILCFGLLLVSY